MSQYIRDAVNTVVAMRTAVKSIRKFRAQGYSWKEVAFIMGFENENDAYYLMKTSANQLA